MSIPEEQMMAVRGKVAVLGLYGHVGAAVARAFVAAGWQVRGMARRQRHIIAGVEFIEADAEGLEDLQRAIGDADVVFNGLNLAYDKWDQGRLEALMARVLAAMGTGGRTMLFPGNIYNYPASLAHVTPDAAQQAQTPRGDIRVRVEAMYEAAATRGDIQLIILRAGDFYGPGSRADWFDQAMLRDIKNGKVATLGKAGIGHAWAYLPDLGRAFEKLAWRRKEFGAFERFHFAGHFVTPEQMGAAIRAALPEPVKLAPFPFWLLGVMGLANPVMREAAKMGYLWSHPMRLEDQRLEEILGPGFNTAFDRAIAATVAPLQTEKRVAA